MSTTTPSNEAYRAAKTLAWKLQLAAPVKDKATNILTFGDGSQPPAIIRRVVTIPKGRFDLAYVNYKGEQVAVFVNAEGKLQLDRAV